MSTPTLPELFSLARARPVHIVGALFGGLLFAFPIGVLSAEWWEYLAAAIQGAAFGSLIGLALEAVTDRRHLANREEGKEWQASEREKCRQRAIDRQVTEGEPRGLDPEDDDPKQFIGRQMYSGEYKKATDQWQKICEARLRLRNLIAGAAVVVAAFGSLTMISPTHLPQLQSLTLFWPFAVCLLLTVGLVLEIHMRGSLFDAHFDRWLEWAKAEDERLERERVARGRLDKGRLDKGRPGKASPDKASPDKVIEEKPPVEPPIIPPKRIEEKDPIFAGEYVPPPEV